MDSKTREFVDALQELVDAYGISIEIDGHCCDDVYLELMKDHLVVATIDALYPSKPFAENCKTKGHRFEAEEYDPMLQCTDCGEPWWLNHYHVWGEWGLTEFDDLRITRCTVRNCDGYRTRLV